MYNFPALDCHAHVAHDVTKAQVNSLEGAIVFAMTRSLNEFRAASNNRQPGMVWAIGAHPGNSTSLDQWSEERFLQLAKQSPIIGEVGLDRRGDLETQVRIFREILINAGASLISVHSTGRTRQVIDALEKNGHPGVILHWFLGNPDEVSRATAMGCYFSINAAMSDAQLTALPLDRVLPETDFPSSRSRTRARVPGDVLALEKTVARLTRRDVGEVRKLWYRNLRRLSLQAEVVHRLPAGLAAALEMA
ncbi:TatD family hydrolase [Leifsonia sp. 21MFCrub1.1]|uniref:TatD family hydrolase n=1 Tax=Leifsonia sp. 21MFCrub1.1 TaxID=1798223 RepID=UPI0008929329|nr:TatD family hydrolase [Leifsonia sp. 21MFCrub1.1]SEB08914.1 TatD DNase family protein [Leifsonia sp. 21MFCrub1.1]